MLSSNDGVLRQYEKADSHEKRKRMLNLNLKV